jgi:pimeloyl-ACP methyl ester carboxylesterase
VGFSIGSGVAAHLARHRPAAGLVLVTPFDSLEALARDLYWWAPSGLLLRHRMPTVDFVRGSPVPTALIMAGRDAIVPARRGMALRQRSEPGLRGRRRRRAQRPVRPPRLRRGDARSAGQDRGGL